MRSIKKIFGDLSVTLKIVLLIFVVALVYFAKEATYMYITLKDNVQNLTGARMEFVARTAALVINGDSHQQIVKAYLDRDPDLTKRDDFKKIQRLLRRIQKINELGSDIYTLVQPQWKEDALVFITMSNPKTYVGNSVPTNPAALECLRTGKPTRTPFYQDRKGTWISAYAPIRNSKRSVIAMVAVDYRVDGELSAAARQVLEWAGLPSAALFFFFLIVAALVGRSIASPLEEMTDAVTSVADGVPGGNIFTARRDEIGKLAQAVNTMLESSTRNKLDSRGELSSLREEREKLNKNLNAKDLELKRTVQAYQALLGKLDEGCFIFLKDGKILPQYSKICEEYLEMAPDKLPVWTVLGMDAGIGQTLIEEIFAERHPIHETLKKLPQSRRHSNGRRIHLTYHPLRNSNKDVTGIVAIASPKEPGAQHSTRPVPPPLPETNLRFADRILKYKHQVAHYIRNTRGGLHVLQGALHNTSVLRSEAAREILEEIRSGAMLFALRPVEEKAKLVEEAFQALKSNPGHSKFVDQFEAQIADLNACIDDFVKESENLLGLELHSTDHTLEISHRELLDFSKAIAEASSPKEIKESFDAHFVREPVLKFVGHFDDLVQQLAQKHGKRLHPLRITGGETRIVPEAYLELLAELLHPLKNAVEFGVELPAERQVAGKDEAGQISLHISLARGNDGSPDWLFITVEDDGAGINVDALKDRLQKQGAVDLKGASDYEIAQRVLDTRFTTSRGEGSENQRGEGLHHLQRSVKELGGSVEVMSIRGRGTQISIMVPYKENLETDSLPLIRAA